MPHDPVEILREQVDPTSIWLGVGDLTEGWAGIYARTGGGFYMHNLTADEEHGLCIVEGNTWGVGLGGGTNLALCIAVGFHNLADMHGHSSTGVNILAALGARMGAALEAGAESLELVRVIANALKNRNFRAVVGQAAALVNFLANNDTELSLAEPNFLVIPVPLAGAGLGLGLGVQTLYITTTGEEQKPIWTTSDHGKLHRFLGLNHVLRYRRPGTPVRVEFWESVPVWSDNKIWWKQHLGGSEFVPCWDRELGDGALGNLPAGMIHWFEVDLRYHHARREDEPDSTYYRDLRDGFEVYPKLFLRDSDGDWCEECSWEDEALRLWNDHNGGLSNRYVPNVRKAPAS